MSGEHWEQTHMKSLLIRLWKEEEGQDLTEYALLVVLIALAAVTAMKGLANAISNAFASVVAGLSTA
jgi:pilus assembly protein Flp/PilA